MDEVARLTPRFANVSYDKLDKDGSVQWPCNDASPDGMPIMHVNGFTRGRASSSSPNMFRRREDGPRFPLLLTTGASCRNTTSARRRGAPRTAAGTRRTCSKSISTTRRIAASRTGLGQGPKPRGRNNLARQDYRPGGPGVVYTTFHHPMTQPMWSPPTIRTGRLIVRIQGDGGAGVDVQRPERMARAISRVIGDEPTHRDHP